MRPEIVKIGILLISVVNFVCSCHAGESNLLPGTVSEDEISQILEINPDWTFNSHGPCKPDYGIVFSQDTLNRIEITMDSISWNRIRMNMKNLVGCDYGERGFAMPKPTKKEPVYVEVQVKFRGKVWNNAGFRLKGNSSLAHAWGQGMNKLPFKLNFNEFTDTSNVLKHQRFYGFKKLSFSPAFHDESLIREKLASDVFRMAGIPAARTAFYTVYINFGHGMEYCGIYTAVEYPDDYMLQELFDENTGNIYKPESRFVNFRKGEFEKKNNKADTSYSDIKMFIDALNSDLRISKPAQWRSNLEATFNVDMFLRYLAVNNTIVNWDSYGTMAHNFYLYNHSKDKLTWIPWDHNEAFMGNKSDKGTILPQLSGPPPFPVPIPAGSNREPKEECLSLT